MAESWDDVVRIYVVGRVMVEGPDDIVEASGLPGRQGRLALVYLAVENRRIDRHELASVLWPDELPEAWETGLSSVMSKLRKALARVGGDAAELIDSAHGAYEIRRRSGLWIDYRTAINELDRAEGAMDAGDARSAWTHATVASSVFRRRFLPGESGPWIDRMRRDLREYEIRTYDLLARVWLALDKPQSALPLARHAVDLAPYRESGYARLMECHIASGDNAEAVRVYGDVRQLLTESLGVSPSDRLERLYEQSLR